MSAPSSPVLSVPQDELSSQFFNFNHQQCLLNQLKNYWHKTIFPTGQPNQSPTLLPPFHTPQEWATTTHTFIFKPWIISECQPKFFIILVSHLNLKIQGGTRFGNRKEQIFSCKLMYLQEGKCLFNDFFFVSPLQEFMTTVKVWENVIIQWITLLVIKNSNNKLTRLQTSWKLADHHIHINQSKHAYTLFEQCHSY